jgi:AraC-like DNA-binding protein
VFLARRIVGHVSGVAAPSPALAPFVASIGYFEGRFDHARELALPSGAGQLLINLDRDELHSYDLNGRSGQATSGAALLGPAAGPALIDPAEQRRIMWVAFRPGGSYPFFAPDAADTADRLIDLGDLWGPAGPALRERLLAAGDVAERLRVLEAALAERAASRLCPDGAVRSAVAALHHGCTVAAAADGLGWTPRRLARRFAARVGLSPKRFARVRRFQRLLVAASGDAGRDAGRAGPDAGQTGRDRPDWARLAVECGYHDQAHLIHDFRELAGTTPGGYTPRPDAPNHVVR